MQRLQLPSPVALVVACAATVFLLGTTALRTEAQERAQHSAFAAGDVIPVHLDEELSSDQSRRGDRFTATVDADPSSYRHLRGAVVEGQVTEAKPRKGDQPGRLRLAFTRLRTRHGHTYPIHGSVIGLDNHSVEQRDGGLLVAKPGEKKKYLEFAGIGAGAGALVSVLGSGKLKLENVLIGGLLGAGAAQLTKGKTETRDVKLKKGTRIGVRLDSRFDYESY
jgi:hypothetical protein